MNKKAADALRDSRRGETASLIDVRNLVKRYDDKLVLNGFSLTVERGETCVIIGASGSGKSTFARLLVGLERPDSGEIRIAGIDIVHLGARERDGIRKKFAFVFQQSGLLDSMSVFDNVAFPLREARHLSATDIEQRVHLTLRELDIEDAASKLPGELSGGMAKRVGIARAVVTEPEILVYDEPTSGIDPIGARVIDGLIERMRVLHGVTSVVISHDMVTAYDVADRVVLLANGKAVAQGAPEVLFRSHATAIEPFARASGIDLANLTSRSSRVPTAKIRAQWVASHLPSPESSRAARFS
jgi:phospholipid/cholesterol/gamma-HCH transport system ATP-binding protein